MAETAEPLVKKGQEFTYIGIKYVIIEVTETSIKYQRVNAGKYDPIPEMRIGSSKFVSLFGGDRVDIPTGNPTTKVTKQSRPAIVEDEEDDDEDLFEEGPVVAFLDSVIEAESSKDKIKALKAGLFDFESDTHLSNMFIIYCAIEARQLVFAEPEEIIKHMLEFEKPRAMSLSEDIFELVDSFLGKDSLKKAEWEKLIEMIPVREQNLIAYALGGWGIEKTGLKKKELEEWYYKAWDQMSDDADAADEDELKI